MTNSRDMPVAFVGLMGAGKSAVARLVGARLGVEVADLDARVEAACGLPVAQVFERIGEAAFREREAQALANAVDEGAPLIDGGGGLVLDATNRGLLRTRCRTVWLEVSPEVAAARIASEAGQRPLLTREDAPARLAGLLRERTPFYVEVAWRRVPTEGRAVDQVADDVLRLLTENR